MAMARRSVIGQAGEGEGIVAIQFADIGYTAGAPVGKPQFSVAEVFNPQVCYFCCLRCGVFISSRTDLCGEGVQCSIVQCSILHSSTRITRPSQPPISLGIAKSKFSFFSLHKLFLPT